MEKTLHLILEKLDNLETGQNRLESRIVNLEKGQRNLENRMGKLEEGQRKLEEGQKRIKETLHRMEVSQQELTKALLEMTEMKENDKVEIKVLDGNLIISPVKKRKTLEERIAEYNGDYNCSEWDTGKPTDDSLFTCYWMKERKRPE